MDARKKQIIVLVDSAEEIVSALEATKDDTRDIVAIGNRQGNRTIEAILSPFNYPKSGGVVIMDEKKSQEAGGLEKLQACFPHLKFCILPTSQDLKARADKIKTFLAEHSPTQHVVLLSTSEILGIGMKAVLEKAGFNTSLFSDSQDACAKVRGLSGKPVVFAVTMSQLWYDIHVAQLHAVAPGSFIVIDDVPSSRAAESRAKVKEMGIPCMPLSQDGSECDRQFDYIIQSIATMFAAQDVQRKAANGGAGPPSGANLYHGYQRSM